MTTQSMEKINFISNLNETSDQKDLPQWLQDIRQESLTQWQGMKAPSVRDEEWKYTSLQALLKSQCSIDHSLSDDVDLAHECLLSFFDHDDCRIVLVNGVYSQKWSQTNCLPEGVVVVPFCEALKQHEADIKQSCETFLGQHETYFSILNNAVMQRGVFIKASKNVVLKKRIHIVNFVTDAAVDHLISPRHIIKLETGAQISILETHMALHNDIRYVVNSVSDIDLGDNAHLHYVKVEKHSEQAFHLDLTRVQQSRDSQLNAFTLTTNTGFTRNNLHVDVNGEGAHAAINSLYSVFNKQFVDNHTMIDHKVPNATSSQHYKGILNHQSKGVFNGKVFVRSIAQLTNSFQMNRNLLIGDKARIDTKPQLEIEADDVKCTHGATIGQLEEDEIFYLQTRGIAKGEATTLLTKAFAEEILSEIKDKVLLEKLRFILQISFKALTQK